MIFRIDEKTLGKPSEATERTRISRANKKGLYFRLKRGLYSDDPKENPLWIANAIRVPSYVSFEYALSLHGLIPEKVYEITSATVDIRTREVYINHFGRFSYRSVPKNVYSLGLVYSDQTCIASAEKALCDMLHAIRSVRNRKDLLALLFEDLRIDEDGFESLDSETLVQFCNIYPGETFRVLKAFLEEKK